MTQSEHAKAAGSETARTAFYPQEMTELIISALYLSKVQVHCAGDALCSPSAKPT